MSEYQGVSHDCSRDGHEFNEDDNWKWCIHCGYTQRKLKEMADSMHCGDQRKHAPHTWYSPTTEKGKTVQVAHNCPGSV